MLIIDARSVYDYLTRESGKLPQDKRLAIDLRVLQLYMEEGSWQLRWVCGPQMLRDVLTKSNADCSYLGWCMENARYRLLEDKGLSLIGSRNAARPMIRKIG